MTGAKVKLKIPEFGIDSWVTVNNPYRSSLKALLESYILVKPITSSHGLAYTYDSAYYLKTLKCNVPGIGLITKSEAPSRLVAPRLYVTRLWQCIFTNVAGGRYRIFTRPGLNIDTIIKFKNGDEVNLGLIIITSSVRL